MKKKLSLLLAAFIITIVTTHDTYANVKPIKQPTINNPNDITFIVMGDPQFWGEAPDWRKTAQVRPVEEMNRLGFSSDTVWPEGTSCAGEQVNTPVAVFIAGDITHMTTDDELDSFRKLYEPKEDYSPDYDGVKIRDDLPVYPGAGNHEYQNGPEKAKKMRDYIESRIKKSKAIVNFDPYTKNYSWDFGPIHFLQLHTWAGQTYQNDPENYRLKGLDWLAKDLETHVGKSQRPVIIIQHYASITTDRWPIANQQLFINVLNRRSSQDSTGSSSPYNVLGIFSGHHHYPNRVELNGIPNFISGDGQASDRQKDLCDSGMAFLVVRIHTTPSSTEEHDDITIDVANFDIQETAIESKFVTLSGKYPYTKTVTVPNDFKP